MATLLEAAVDAVLKPAERKPPKLPQADLLSGVCSAADALLGKLVDWTKPLRRVGKEQLPAPQLPPPIWYLASFVSCARELRSLFRAAIIAAGALQ